MIKSTDYTIGSSKILGILMCRGWHSRGLFSVPPPRPHCRCYPGRFAPINPYIPAIFTTLSENHSPFVSHRVLRTISRPFIPLGCLHHWRLVLFTYTGPGRRLRQERQKICSGGTARQRQRGGFSRTTNELFFSAMFMRSVRTFPLRIVCSLPSISGEAVCKRQTFFLGSRGCGGDIGGLAEAWCGWKDRQKGRLLGTLSIVCCLGVGAECRGNFTFAVLVADCWCLSMSCCVG